MVGVMRKIAFCSTAYPAVDLLERGADPQGIDAKLLQVVEFAGKPLQVAAVKGANLLHPVFVASVAVVIRRIAVDEAVSQHEIDRRVLPAKGGRGGGFSAFEQQQAAATVSRLQRYLSVLHHRCFLAVEIAHHAPFRECLADVQRQGFTVPGGALAHDINGLGDGFAFYRQH